MITVVKSCALRGIESKIYNIELTKVGSFPSFDLVGLLEHSARESRVRVRSAIRQSGFDFPNKRVIANFCYEFNDGPTADLAVAIGILAMEGFLPDVELDNFLTFGELSLSGEIRPVRGAICHAAAASNEGLTVLCSASNAHEAHTINSRVIAGRNLQELVENILADRLWTPGQERSPFQRSGRDPCWSDVRGQEKAKRALEIAVAGGFDIMLVGPPGAGKTMLARRLPHIMPNIHISESVEVTKVHSAAGILPRGESLSANRPFRAPHHTGSSVSMVGGGGNPRPGEVSLAHRGVLFLDELPEFPVSVIESVAVANRDKKVTIERSGESIAFQANFMLVASANKCPCGFMSSHLDYCRCNRAAIDKLQERNRMLSSMLGIKLVFNMDPTPPRLLRNAAPGDDNYTVRRRVSRAQELQRWSLGCLASEADMPLLDAVAFTIASLDGRSVPDSNDTSLAAELFGLEDNTDAVNGRR